jgi:hypothetical protein
MKRNLPNGVVKEHLHAGNSSQRGGMVEVVVRKEEEVRDELGLYR